MMADRRRADFAECAGPLGAAVTACYETHA